MSPHDSQGINPYKRQRSADKPSRRYEETQGSEVQQTQVTNVSNPKTPNGASSNGSDKNKELSGKEYARVYDKLVKHVNDTSKAN